MKQTTKILLKILKTIGYVVASPLIIGNAFGESVNGDIFIAWHNWWHSIDYQETIYDYLWCCLEGIFLTIYSILLIMLGLFIEVLSLLVIVGIVVCLWKLPVLLWCFIGIILTPVVSIAIRKTMKSKTEDK